jgi:hypothetical protein
MRNHLGLQLDTLLRVQLIKALHTTTDHLGSLLTKEFFLPTDPLELGHRTLQILLSRSTLTGKAIFLTNHPFIYEQISKNKNTQPGIGRKERTSSRRITTWVTTCVPRRYTLGTTLFSLSNDAL